MGSDFLFINELIAGDSLRLEGVVGGSHLIKTGRAKGGAINGFEGRFFNRIVNQGQARIERRIEMAVLIITSAEVEMEVSTSSKIALHIDPVALLAAGNRRLAAEGAFLVKIIAEFRAHGDEVPVPKPFVYLHFGAPPFTGILFQIELVGWSGIADLMSKSVIIKPGGYIPIVRETVREFQCGVALLIGGAQPRVVEDGSKQRRGIDFFAMMERALEREIMVIERAEEACGLVAIEVVRHAIILGGRVEFLVKEAPLAAALVIRPGKQQLDAVREELPIARARLVSVE